MADGRLDLCESLHGAAFEALPDAICIVEPTGDESDGQRDWRYLSCNLALRRMLEIDDMVGQTLRQRFPGEADRWSREFQQVLDSGETMRLVHTRSHRVQVLETMLIPIANGERQAVMVRIRDITDDAAVEDLRLDGAARRDDQKRRQRAARQKPHASAGPPTHSYNSQTPQMIFHLLLLLLR